MHVRIEPKKLGAQRAFELLLGPLDDLVELLLALVNFEIITVSIAWLYICAPTSERAGAPNIDVCSSPRGG